MALENKKTSVCGCPRMGKEIETEYEPGTSHEDRGAGAITIAPIRNTNSPCPFLNGILAEDLANSALQRTQELV
jgi:hypothetical protein